MTARSVSRLLVAVGLLLAPMPARSEPAAESAAEPVISSAEVIQACVNAHERARLFWLQAELGATLRALADCRTPACPLAIRADCEAWQAEVERSMPSVLFVLEAPPERDAQLRIFVDGKAIARPSDGQSLALEPGEHRIRIELPPYAPVEHVVTLREGERNRLVRARFAASPPVAATPPAPPPARPAGPDRTRPAPVATYLLLSGAVASAAVGSAFLAVALSDKARAAESCAPLCDESLKRSIQRNLLVADVMGAAALVLGAGALYTIVRRSSDTSKAPVSRPRLALTLTPHTRGLELGGKF